MSKGNGRALRADWRRATLRSIERIAVAHLGLGHCRECKTLSDAIRHISRQTICPRWRKR